MIHLEALSLGVSTTATITIEGAAPARRDRTAEKVERLVKAFRMDSLAKLWLVSRLDELAAAPERLADFGVDVSPGQMRALLETTQGAGAHYVADRAEPHLLVLWNNRESAGFRHHFAQLRPHKWSAHERYGSSWGATPRFRAIRPEGDRWRLAVDYFGLHIQNFGRQ